MRLYISYRGAVREQYTCGILFSIVPYISSACVVIVSNTKLNIALAYDFTEVAKRWFQIEVYDS